MTLVRAFIMVISVLGLALVATQTMPTEAT